MAGTSTRSNPPRTRKRVDSETNSSKRPKDTTTATTLLKRAKDGSAFTRCDECKKDVPVVLIDMHNCSLDSKLKMSLDSTVVKKAVETKKPAPPRKKGVKSAPKSKKSKDPNMPKRPQTAFFLFMDDFRKSFKESHPDNKKVGVVAKEGGETWKNMPDEEKKVYLDRAAELKREYEKAVENLNSENENGEVEEEQEDDEKAEEKPDSENEHIEEDQGEVETGDEDEKVEGQLDSANEDEQDKQESDKGED